MMGEITFGSWHPFFFFGRKGNLRILEISAVLINSTIIMIECMVGQGLFIYGKEFKDTKFNSLCTVWCVLFWSLISYSYYITL